MESDVYSSAKAQRRRSITPPPNVSEEQRIVLLGKNGLNSRVGNFILGRDAFNTEAPPPTVKQHSEKDGGTVEGRYITIINTPHLFHPLLSVEELNQRVRECMILGSPGPHVLVLVLQPDDFTETDRDRLYHILHSLSEDPQKHTLVVTTQKLQSDSCTDRFQEDLVKEIIDECSSMHFEIKKGCSCADLVKVIQMLVEKNGGSHIIWETHEAASPTTERPFRKSEQIQMRGDMEKLEEENIYLECEASASTSETLKPQLNLVVCGRNQAVKASLLDLLLDRKTSKPKVVQSSSVCVSREAEVCGRLITLVELPALYSSQLSEEEVIRETLRCVSLCDPGVHAFLFVVPAGPLTDEDKRELEKIQRTFGSRIKENSIVLFTTELNADRGEVAAWLDSETIQFLSMCEGRYKVLEKMENGNLKPVPTLLDELVTMATRNKPADHFDAECLRLVLIGKTGNGKSATGNSILGLSQFDSRASMRGVTSKCQKEFGKVLGKSVAVVDTPGLFDNRFTNEKVTEEIAKCISLSAPGPHAFIIVLSVGRFTKEEMDTVDLIKDIFGPEAVKYSVVLFTRGDELAGETIEEYVKRCGHDDVNKLIKDCGGRVHMFNNKVNHSSQVSELLRKIEEMIQFNRNNYFTNDMLKLAERTIQQKTEEIMRGKKLKIQNSIKSLKKDYMKEVERNTLHNKREREQAEVKQRRVKKEIEKRMKLLTSVTEKREERKQKELEIEETEREKELTGKKLRPVEAEELKHPKQSTKKMIKKFEGIINQDKQDRQSETERRKKMEREQRMRENKDIWIQTTKERKNKGQEQKVCEEKRIEEERKMLERQEELRRREEEDRMKKESEDKEHKQERKERKVCEEEGSEEERKMLERLERERQEELRRREEEDRMKKESEDKKHKEERRERKVCEEEGGEEEWKKMERLELERECQEELRRIEEEERMRKERENKEHEEMKNRFEKRLNELKIQYEKEARAQAELISDLMPLLEDEISEVVNGGRGRKRGKKAQCVFL